MNLSMSAPLSVALMHTLGPPWNRYLMSLSGLLDIKTFITHEVELLTSLSISLIRICRVDLSRNTSQQAQVQAHSTPEGETTRRKARLLFLAVVFVDAGRDHIVISRCGKLPDETLQYLLMALAVWLISIAIKVGKRFALRPVPEIPSQRADNG